MNFKPVTKMSGEGPLNKGFVTVPTRQSSYSRTSNVSLTIGGVTVRVMEVRCPFKLNITKRVSKLMSEPRKTITSTTLKSSTFILFNFKGLFSRPKKH